MRNGHATREKIKRAALVLFVARGVDGTGVRDIARACDITDGALYRHFKGKDALVWTLFSEPYADYADKLEALAGQQSGTAAKIEAMVRGFCAFFDEDETLFRFLLLVQHGQLAKVGDDMRTPVQVLEDVIASGIAAREVAYADVPAATAAVLGVVLQTATFKIYDRLPGSLSSRADDLSRACLNAIGVQA